MKSNVKIYNKGNLDTKVLYHGGDESNIKLYKGGKTYETGLFYQVNFISSDDTMGFVTCKEPPSPLGYEIAYDLRIVDNKIVYEYDYNKVIAEAVPNSSSYEFSHWEINGEEPQGTMVIVTKDLEIKAVFESSLTLDFDTNGLGYFEPEGLERVQLPIENTEIIFSMSQGYITIRNIRDGVYVDIGRVKLIEPANEIVFHIADLIHGGSSYVLSEGNGFGVLNVLGLASGNLDKIDRITITLPEPEPTLIDLAYNEHNGAQIQWYPDKDAIILTGSDGKRLAIADTDYGMPTFREIFGKDITPDLSDKQYEEIMRKSYEASPLAYIPGYDDYPVFDDIAGHMIQLFTTKKDWEGVGLKGISTEEFQWIEQSMTFQNNNERMIAEGIGYGHLELNKALNFYSGGVRQYDFQKGENRDYIHNYFASPSVAYIPSDFYNSGRVAWYDGYGIHTTNLNMEDFEFKFELYRPGRIRKSYGFITDDFFKN